MKKQKFEINTLKELTPEQITSFKQQFGEIYCIEVEDKKAYLHPPTRHILDAAAAGSKKAESKFNEILIKGCWLAGDKEIVENDAYFLAAATQLGEIITVKEATLKKL